MFTNLTEKINSLIKQQGFISIDSFISMALSDNDFGYYKKKLPIGSSQDFTTAPEISQLFGEMIAFWVIECWQQMGELHKINIVELGSGRGTMMLDILNIAKKLPNFFNSLSVNLVDINPSLINTQKQNLNQFLDIIKWHNSLDNCLNEIDKIPTIILANEFFDALPTKQFKLKSKEWHEVIVSKEEKNNSLTLALNKNIEDLDHLLPNNFTPQDGMVFEYSPITLTYIKTIAKFIKQNKGSLLLIDYGYSINPFTNTLQAIKNHQKVSFLSSPGETDLTYLVNFPLILNTLKQNNAPASLTTQREFLINTGIQSRLNVLLKVAGNNKDKQDLIAGVERITSIDNMGTLFKVLTTKCY